ncbi:WPP domain-associated protein-like [Iris pallida]|uniref:WPP domain-associated protein-like n=1 Tax=Iris pallida TaxID=29817 RepID=A0AAX6EM78_IRIPA|nr:WPP domain-associated protein-like [Iris pallida]
MEVTQLDSRSGLSVDGSLLTRFDDKSSPTPPSPCGDGEGSILDEMDSYLEDLSARLSVSRMVNDSIIKGMVNAIDQEAAAKVALKEAEVAILKQKLQYYETHAANVSRNNSDLLVSEETMVTKPHLLQCYVQVGQEVDFVKKLNRLATREEQLQGLWQGILKDSVDEYQGQAEDQKRIGRVMVQTLIRDLQEEFETKISEQNSLISMTRKNWGEMVQEISTMRQELDVVYASLCSSELLASSHNTLECSEECNSGKRMDQSPWKVLGNHLPSTFNAKATTEDNHVLEKSKSLGSMLNDSPQLKSMTKEQLIAYFKTEMTKMKRQHDQALQEKTEELFSIKRELLNEKGSSPLHFRKDKDIELVRKKLLEFMKKLDEFLLAKRKMPVLHDDEDWSHSLKERIRTFLEIQWQKSFLADKEETRCAVLHASPLEADFVTEIEKLQLAMEEAKMETTIREYVYITLLNGFFGELERYEDFEMERKMKEDIYSFIYKAALGDILTGIKSTVAELYEEKNHINSILLEKEKTLCSEVKENGRLKEEIASLSTLLEEKEKLASDARFELTQQKEQFDSVCHKLDECRNRISEQEIIITNTKREFDLLIFKLEERIQQAHQSEVEISNLNQKFKIVSNALEEAERQKQILYIDIQEKQEKLVSVLTKEKDQNKKLEPIIVSMTELSKAIEDWESRLTESIEISESSMERLNSQFAQLMQHASLLQRQVLWYKQSFERRCQDLQKAETEVDLLGDEVDVLLGLLEKIYMALDHYSPVLQHYPGVVEILKLISMEMKGEHGKLA